MNGDRMTKTIKLSSGEVMPERKKNNNRIIYRITWGAIILLTIVIGYLFTAKSQSESRITKIEDTNSEIRIMISEMATDIKWIKQALKEK